MKVALVHDWLTGMRGGEKCLEVLCELFPDADLYTLLHVRGTVSPRIEDRRIVTSFVQRLPAVSRYYRYCLPLLPAAVEQFDLRDYDVVLSSSHCVAKGAIPAPGALHLSYVHTPMRYAWDLRSLYFPGDGPLHRVALPPVLHYLRQWDVGSSARVDRFVANSRFVARRIERYYRREASVLHPPVDTQLFRPDGEPAPPGEGEFYLMVGALVPYKGVELAVRAFNRLRLPLRIAGSGPLLRKIRALAGPTVEVTGWLPDEELRASYQAARALIFPSLEDFGIVPLEAQSMGRPVIALGRGGALETVVPANDARNPDLPRPGNAADPPGGVLFRERTPEALIAAVRFFERHREVFDPVALRARALPFDRARFRERLRRLVDEAVAAHDPGRRGWSPLDSRGTRSYPTRATCSF